MTPEQMKPVHAKPSLYAFYYEALKGIAFRYGYNLVLHGSLNRDLDLIAIPWAEEVGSHDEMIEEFILILGGDLMYANGVVRSHARKTGQDQKWEKYKETHHGRMQYVINLNRECAEKDGKWTDPQYYIDISVMPTTTKPQQP
jgi:hypothetical protein